MNLPEDVLLHATKHASLKMVMYLADLNDTMLYYFGEEKSSIENGKYTVIRFDHPPILPTNNDNILGGCIIWILRLGCLKCKILEKLKYLLAHPKAVLLPKYGDYLLSLCHNADIQRFILSLPGFNYEIKPGYRSSLCMAVIRHHYCLMDVLLADERITLDGLLATLKCKYYCVFIDEDTIKILVNNHRVMNMLVQEYLSTVPINDSVDLNRMRRDIIENLPRMKPRERDLYIQTTFFVDVT
jgi:hypothetical protein